MYPENLLTGENAAFVDVLYDRWLEDPAAVGPEWRALFEAFGRPDAGFSVGPRAPRPSVFAGGGGTTDAEALGAATKLQTKVGQLINAYRVRGHVEALIDPLDRREKREHPELTLPFYGLGDADLDAVVATAPVYGVPESMPLRDLLAHLRKAYCGKIGAEFMNINEIGEKRWLQEQLETLPNRKVLDREQDLHVLRKLSDAENFERMLHQRFPGTKRFSLEGAETLIPLLDMVLERSGRGGVRELVIGMAHRGRLNVLVNTLEKPVRVIVQEFEDTKGVTQGSGDVKYHLGYSADVYTRNGDCVHVNLAFNPSHLEAVDPVVEGRVRAKQDRAKDLERQRAMAVLIHGDAAFAGQGLVAEVLNLSELTGYRTGGTLHIIVNNQIGFTTPPHEARSTPYATDIARMLAIPILHVNGEDPRAVAAVVQIAMDWRLRYHRDVVIDMYCYRKHGHNEGDEPSFTQPVMYGVIRSRPTPREVYARRLVQLGDVGQDDVKRIDEESLSAIESALAERVAPVGAAADRARDDRKTEHDIALFQKKRVENGMAGRRETVSPMKGMWARYQGSIHDETDTTVPIEHLRALMIRQTELPQDFHAHAKIKRLLAQRREIAERGEGVDWSSAELAAFASLVDGGNPVRLSGQDSGRGTFSQRHAALTDIQTGQDWFPLAHLREGQADFRVIDSPLSEAAVLGFEFGFTLDMPEALVLWEAQFGDFANGAQVIVDQFLVASEQKWNRRSGLVMLLPHGYEGQGPEHSSAKIERFLQMCAEENMQVANCTTPANYFHLLRRQVLRGVRKPLIVATPKSLLRHELAVSTLEDLASGRFERVIGETDPIAPESVRRLVLCSGKVYYELLAERRQRGTEDVALARVELLAPFPIQAVLAEIARWPNLEEIAWVQEEPKNMGAFTYAFFALQPELSRAIRYIGRPAAASPATGSNRRHRATQAALVAEALSLEAPAARLRASR